MRHPLPPAIDEEALAAGLNAHTRRRRGAYFTPGPLVDWVLETIHPLVPAGEPLAVVDPSCGAGAFLARAPHRFPAAHLFGLELSEATALTCRERVPEAHVMVGDAFRGGLERLSAAIPPGAFELWLGNPPYNGTSPALEDPALYARLQRLLPAEFKLPPGTSLRDDYAFFLLLAAQRLQHRRGLLAFVTNASLLDAFMYAPVREALRQMLTLREVLELEPGVFAGTRIRTCVTVWETRGASRRPVCYRHHAGVRGFDPAAVGPAREVTPIPPEYLLRPIDERAAQLDERWRRSGEPLSQLVPVSLPGLKTRFDELLVDADPHRLVSRVQAFLECTATQLEAFARTHQMSDRCLGKLTALKNQPRLPTVAELRFVRPFYRYAGARHRGVIPESARAYCYLDRRLIPRGDHRLRGDYDPHLHPHKFVFNTRELPLSAALLLQPGCVHDHRHSRFAPFLVPQLILEQGLSCTRRAASFGQLHPNLSARGRAQAQRLGGVEPFFRALTAFINGSDVQGHWAPAFGASRELSVPVEELERC